MVGAAGAAKPSGCGQLHTPQGDHGLGYGFDALCGPGQATVGVDEKLGAIFMDLLVQGDGDVVEMEVHGDQLDPAADIEGSGHN